MTKREPPEEKPSYEIEIVGAHPAPLRDFYHALLKMRWGWTFLVISVTFMLTNALFALGYWRFGGVAHARPGSYADAFFFSVQTMGTIGYGAMYPESLFAEWEVVTESLTGLILTALTTGLVFAKFSRPTARMVFTRQATISRMNSVPTLALRIGNERSNLIVDAQIKVSLSRTELTAEGHTFYRMYDLKLARSHTMSLSRSWTVMHAIDAESPLFGASPTTLKQQEAELMVLVTGMDDITMQPVQATHRYFAHQILWGARHADVLTDYGTRMVLDLRRFHELESTPASEEFPYSARV